MTLDFYAQTVNMGSETILLSNKEFSLLSYMAQNVNRVIRVDALFQFTWGTDSLEDTRTVSVHISNLRKKIEAEPANPERIVTIRGTGYMLVARSAL
ncbi:winged helix-turn-helix domain-containing protein [Cohnella sp. WQ 127256]|uniref:winged helix-turn-helix domain-containing protein n=1 Tax=Cohnella sp. WQ 127256 TaxID=2938790 RepID=UPI00211916E2|nr:winged helix-turn-helix domain-containing protein [Cohnella sp. WQ 127256]